ncbi:DUF6151 family protein [Microbulbifer taiwanensis]|uniref:DUF6151 family protein n=1 Tax=Microbulbifer taiwanensis TaxID=986746 RepID=UPI0018677CBB|nr:DUF6151 family protein [Microbulbifer taiwanensis]
MADIPLKCDCGEVQGVAREVTPGSGNRVICYCDDCQAFAIYLGRADDVLDEHGGTDIFQLTPSQIGITEGQERIRCMRLSDKGMYRWYTECCKTPIGNTLSAAGPFVGMIHSFMDDRESRDRDLGAVRGYVGTKFSTGALSEKIRKRGFPLTEVIRTVYKLVLWKIGGKNRPSPFFRADGTPVSEPYVLHSRVGVDNRR